MKITRVRTRVFEWKGKVVPPQAHDPHDGLDLDHGPRMEAEGAHGFLRCVQQVHRVGAEVALRRNGLAFPLENTGADGFDLHGVYGVWAAIQAGVRLAKRCAAPMRLAMRKACHMASTLAVPWPAMS